MMRFLFAVRPAIGGARDFDGVAQPHRIARCFQERSNSIIEYVPKPLLLLLRGGAHHAFHRSEKLIA
jgi:hypothetical protein